MVTTILFENPNAAFFLILAPLFLLEYIKISISEIDIINILILKAVCLFLKFKTITFESLFTVFKVFPNHHILRLYRERYNLKTKPFIVPEVNIYPAITVFISKIRKITHDFIGYIKSSGYMFSIIAVSNDKSCY